VSFRSFSGEGEDMILRKIFYKKLKGFYVDVGAYHPKKSSNTYYFYQKGWSGINIDAMPGSMNNFQKLRSRDINLEYPLGKEGEAVKFYEFEDKALNGFESPKLKSKDQSKPQNRLKKVHELRARSLNSILEEFLSKDQEIDFLTIDVEGQELTIMESFDFDKYRPKWILAEIWDYSMQTGIENPVDTILKQNGYVPKAKTLNTVFYQKAK
jgi:FkbM family methyltransferase